MNTQLIKLFEVYNISPKDQHEIQQMFTILSSEKRINFLDNFPQLARDLKNIQHKIAAEREILLDKGFERIYTAIDKIEQELTK